MFKLHLFIYLLSKHINIRSKSFLCFLFFILIGNLWVIGKELWILTKFHRLNDSVGLRGLWFYR